MYSKYGTHRGIYGKELVLLPTGALNNKRSHSTDCCAWMDGYVAFVCFVIVDGQK